MAAALLAFLPPTAQADGITWITQTSAADNLWRSVTWGGPTGQEKFVAVAGSGSGNRVMTSPDGTTWTAQNTPANSNWHSVVWGGPAGQEKFVAVANLGTGPGFTANRIMTSPDGITWTPQTAPANSNFWRSVTWGGPTGQEKFVAVADSGSGNRVMTSPDGITWTTQSTPADNEWFSVTWGGPAGQEKFVAVAISGTGNRVMTSPDGITWTAQNTPANNYWRSVTWGGPAGQEKFVAVANDGSGNRVMTSPDGITWTVQSSAADNQWFAVTWGGPTGQEKYVAVAQSGTGNRVMTSGPAATAPGAPTINSVTPGDGTLTVAFTAGTASSNPTTNYKYSTDGVTYTALSPASTTSPFTITGLTNGTAYSVTIKAVNSVGDSAASNAVSGTPAASSSGSSSTSTSSTSSTTTSTTVATTTTNTAPSASTIKLFLPKNLATITTETLSTGDDIELDAGGFQPAETVIVGFAEDPTGVSTVTASAAGRASATVEIPATRNGKVTAYLYGTSSKRGVKQTLTVADLPATGADTSLPTLYGVLLVVSGMLIVARRRLVR
jgi:LPXTG-motif cell wall-anchored protein